MFEITRYKEAVFHDTDGEKLTYRFNIGIRNWVNLTRALKSLTTLYFNGILLNKVYKLK